MMCVMRGDENPARPLPKGGAKRNTRRRMNDATRTLRK